MRQRISAGGVANVSFRVQINPNCLIPSVEQEHSEMCATDFAEIDSRELRVNLSAGDHFLKTTENVDSPSERDSLAKDITANPSVASDALTKTEFV